jgi:hypothetical protein
MVLQNKRLALTGLFKVLIITPFSAFVVLAPYSLLIGWNIIMLFLFWFIILPFVILYVSSRLLKSEYTLWKAMIAMVSFYAFMVFMTFKHFETDFFLIMILSLLWNSLIMMVVMLVEGDDKNHQRRINGPEGRSSEGT